MQQKFNGLSMPVFTAFGWAGEETAIQYALSQLELFVDSLHTHLPQSIQLELPVHGLNKENQAVYLASSTDVESDAHVVFHARPLSLELQLAITDKKVLAKGLARASKDILNCHHLIAQLGPEWTLRVQQMQYDEGLGFASHYQDIFKDTIKAFNEEVAKEVINKATYLNGEEKWVTPIYVSRRFPSEQASVMGRKIVHVMSEHIAALMPILMLLSGRVKRKPGRKTTAKKTAAAKVSASEVELPADLPPQEGFTYISKLMPLHLRRGFVNLTPQHWPFFARNARTETRPVTVYYDGIYDRKSTVWRLQPNDQARLVLSPPVHEWLEDNFSSSDKIRLTARKLANDELQISLTAVEG